MKQKICKTEYIQTPSMLVYLIQTYFKENILKNSLYLEGIKEESKTLSKSSSNMKEETTTKNDYETLNDNTNELENLLFQRDKIYYEKGIKFNVMICGQKGVGKTTIMEKLYNINISQDKKSLHLKEHVELSYNNHKNKITINLMIDEISSFDNNKINNSNEWVTIINEINRNKMKYYQERQQLYRKNDLIEDKRIHVCLYVVEPKQTTSLDLITMKKISQITNVIPIINKIDLVSDNKELSTMKYELQRMFEIYDIALFQSNDKSDINPVCIYKDDISNLKKIIIDENMIDLIDSNDDNNSNYHYNDLWWEDNLLSKQINLQKKYKELIGLQNGKFEEWIKMLIQKQMRYNTIIERLLNQINLIRKECHELEDKMIAMHETNRYMSTKESTTYTINCNNSSKTLVVTNRVSDSSDNRNEYEYGISYYGVNPIHEKRNKDKSKKLVRNGNNLIENVRVRRY